MTGAAPARRISRGTPAPDDPARVSEDRGETPEGRRWLVERPPSSDAWVLYQNMMRIWRNLFVVASVLAFCGTALVAFAALRVNYIVVLIVGMLASLLLAWWWWHSRPLLGSQD